MASKRTPLPHLARSVPDGAQPERRRTRFARWLKNDQVTAAVYFGPYAGVVWRHLARQTLVLVMDGRVVGRGGVALLLPVVYTGRALPLAWPGRQGAKGHFPEDLHIALVQQGQALIPPGASGGWLGEGEFEGIRLLRTVPQAGWSSVCRTGRPRTASWQGEPLRLDPWGWGIRPGTLVELPAAVFTEDADGPVLLICCWATG